MKLDTKQFKRFKDLEKLIKAKKASSEEEAEFAKLLAIKNEKGSNTIEWWKNYPNLLKDVTNLPFNWIPGTTLWLQVGSSLDELRVGNLAVARLAPGIGRSVSNADPFNTQIRQLWLDLHRKYRGIGTYQASDLGIAIVAIDSLFEMLAKFERMYGVINTYHIGNRVVPYGLKEALGISSDLEENLADFRYTLNLYIEKCKQLCLPKGLSVLESDIIAISNIYKDSQNPRAFLFMFDTPYFGVYDATSLAQGGCVKFQDFSYAYMHGSTESGNSSAFTLSDIQNVLEFVTNALLSDDDIARICSDLLAAYGPENVMQLISVPEQYKVEPVMDYERQVQFHNLTIQGTVGSIYSTADVSATEAAALDAANYYIVVHQSNDMVKYRLCRGTGTIYNVGGVLYHTFSGLDELGVDGDILFDTWVDQPGEVEVMCGTRYTSICTPIAAAATNVYRNEIDVFGTKVVETVECFYFDGSMYDSHTFAGTYVDESWFKTQMYEFMRLSQMDWHPTFLITDSGDAELFGDIDNITRINRYNLSRIHEVALLSGYKIPMVGTGDK